MSNAYKVVVDGSNVATEGRTLPSLSQLDEAVQAFIEEHPGADVLVIVDSSFPNRIDPKDAAIFESAYAAGEIITPPAGTTGRGDAFILKVADKLGATVFSNDSFQEFHGTYDWLFDKGRLVGGKPVPGLGWVFMPRTPVRGPKSRDAVREAKRSTARIGSPEAMRPMPVPKAPPTFAKKSADEDLSVVAPVSGRGGRGGSAGAGRGGNAGAGRGSQADVAGTGADDVRDRDGRRKKRRKRGGRDRDGIEFTDGSEVNGADRAEKGDRAERGDRADRADRDRNRNERASQRGNTEPINGPLTFISFISAHGIGTELDGEVETYSSHGFYVTVGDARGYVPLAGLAIPMPRSAKEMVRRGETHRFVVASFDSARRGIELALVGTPAASEVSTGSVEFSSDSHDAAVPVAKSKRGAKPVGAVASVEESGAKPGRRGAKAAAPTAASAVAKPVAGSQPAKAGKPTKAEKPAKTVKPVNSVETAKPSKTEKPAKAAKPSVAAKPTKAAKPTVTAKPTKAANPTVTGKPTKAMKPTKVAEVAKVVKGAKTAAAAKPAKAKAPKPIAGSSVKSVKAVPVKVTKPTKAVGAAKAMAKIVSPKPIAKALAKGAKPVAAKAPAKAVIVAKSKPAETAKASKLGKIAPAKAVAKIAAKVVAKVSMKSVAAGAAKSAKPAKPVAPVKKVVSPKAAKRK